MLLDPLSIDALKDLITGDSNLTPRYSGPKLIEWFNPYGFEDEYGRRLPENDINKSSSLDFKSMPTKWLLPQGDYKNIMHHKFCVIDLKKVIHGSYNWTNKAKYNQENITVTEDRTSAEKFAKKFVQLAAI